MNPANWSVKMWRHIDGPSWSQYDLFCKNKLPGSKSRQSLYSFHLYATNGDIQFIYFLMINLSTTFIPSA